MIGFSITKETAQSVWTEEITERKYYGDVLKMGKRDHAGIGLNDDIIFTNRLSIIADPFIRENLQNIRYVEWMNAKWKISNVEVSFPRLILDLGGVYNVQE
jgi:hypothetical protein